MANGSISILLRKSRPLSGYHIPCWFREWFSANLSSFSGWSPESIADRVMIVAMFQLFSCFWDASRII